MSLWLESLVFALSGYDGGYEGPPEIAKPAVIFDHLAMRAPRSWWERCLQKGKLRKDHVQILCDLSGAFKEFPKLQGRISYSLLVAMSFLDEEAKPSFGVQPNQQSIEEYIAAAERVLAERPDVRRLGKRITKMAIQIEREMTAKYCPKCKKRRTKALVVMEIPAKWWASEEFYVADSEGDSWIRAKCLTCGTELMESEESSEKFSKCFASANSALKPAETTNRKMKRSASGPKGKKKEEGYMRVCPTCKKRRRKVIQVDECEGTWDPWDGLYFADSDKDSRMYEKCRVCGTIL